MEWGPASRNKCPHPAAWKSMGKLLTSRWFSPTPVCITTHLLLFFFFSQLNCRFPLMKTLKILKPISSLETAYRQATAALKRLKHFGGDRAWAYTQATELSEPHGIRTCAYGIKWKFPSGMFKGPGEYQHWHLAVEALSIRRMEQRDQP